MAGLRDPKTGRTIVRDVYSKEDLSGGPYIDNTPDLSVGFEPHYRASWQTAIGGAPPRILEDNLKRWSGDHILDAHHVLGIFLTNRKIRVLHPKVTDIAPTVLKCFQLAIPEAMEGDSLLD